MRDLETAELVEKNYVCQRNRKVEDAEQLCAKKGEVGASAQ